ncbi:hypothetical protein D3C76_1242690 [compost metagenome]
MAPQAASEAFDASQAAPPAGQVQAHADQQQRCDHAHAQGHRAVGHGPAGQAQQQAGQGVAEDAAQVVGQQQAKAPAALFFGDGQGQGTHQPAAHAQAMAAAQQAEDQRRAEQG